MTSGLRVAIDAQTTPGVTGGVAIAVRSLVRALGQLTDGPESYTIILETREQWDWLKPYLGPNQSIALRARRQSNGIPPLHVRLLRPLRPAVRYMRRLMETPSHSHAWPEVPLSNGYYESLGCDLIHFPTQNYVVCALPTVYNPHDLQHLHYPQFWTPKIIAWRETVYPAGCHFAQTVVVGSEWVKNDVIRHYRVVPDKVQVIREAPSTESYPEPTPERLSAIQQRYTLHQPFALYPANSWSHKNHVRLFQAVALLREKRGLHIQLVCTGSRYEPHWPAIEACIGELNLSHQVKFMGFVPEDDLRAIYRLGQFLVLPTLFEANSLPIFEAWLEGLPVACSNIPALQEQVGDAAQLFDPQDVVSISDAVGMLATDATIREEFRTRGYRRLKEFNWESTAKTYRAVYRRVARYPLTDEDRWLLGSHRMLAPRETMEHRKTCQDSSSL